MLRITFPQKCDASVFAVCQLPEFHGKTQAMFPDYLADKVLRRCHGLDLEVKGFVKGAKGAFSWHARVCLRQFVTLLFCDSSAIRSEHLSGYVLMVRTEMQYVLYQRSFEL